MDLRRVHVVGQGPLVSHLQSRGKGPLQHYVTFVEDDPIRPCRGLQTLYVGSRGRPWPYEQKFCRGSLSPPLFLGVTTRNLPKQLLPRDATFHLTM